MCSFPNCWISKSNYLLSIHSVRTCIYLCPRTIYEKLGGVVPEEQKAVYAQRVEEMVPNIRYCAYNIGDTSADLSQLVKLRSDAPGFDMLASKIDVRQCTVLYNLLPCILRVLITKKKIFPHVHVYRSL